MKKLFFYTTLLLIIFTQSSCFDVIEKISMNDNGSGNFTLILNASKSKTRLNSIMKMKTVNGRKVPSKTEITNKVADIKQYFLNQNGVSNVSTKTDFTNYIFTFSCDFSSIENIESVIKTLQSKKILEADVPNNLYSYNTSTKVFNKNAIPSFKEKYNNMSKADKEVFATATYTSIMQFSSTIKGATNSNYTISKSRKSIKTSGTVLEFINQKKKPQTTIQLN